MMSGCNRVHYHVTMDPEFWDKEEHFASLFEAFSSPNWDLVFFEKAECRCDEEDL